MYEDAAERYAERASGRTSPDEQTDAIGEGLAAIAFALLEVAQAIREATAQQGRD
ncbi:hypothetical protein [Micromonospora zamorensis]|uniref:hypothetical protein n=1 Tax=Micromonospora zamorensis TaxID=709883 RepID=UPI002E187A42